MDVDRDFTAWVERSDAEALARVFDATAGRLLLLALHLAGKGATAEDLVQSTFLIAMARASTWDRRRRARSGTCAGCPTRALDVRRRFR